MLDKSGIYSITSPSGSQYVGSAVNIKRRWSLHLTQLRAGTHHNTPLLSAFKKYGEKGLKFEILLVCDKGDLLMYEQRALDAWNPKYNICKKAGSILGVKLSAETRAKMSAAMKGKKKPPTSPETRAKMSATRKGRKFSDAHRAAIAESNRGRKQPPEAIAKRTETRRKNGITPEGRANMTAGVRAHFAAKRVNKNQMALEF